MSVSPLVPLLRSGLSLTGVNDTLDSRGVVQVDSRSGRVFQWRAHSVKRVVSCGVALLLLLCASGDPLIFAQDESPQKSADLEEDEMFENLPKWNLPAPTLGGRQFWGDIAFFRGYRIQHYVGTERYRLIDPGDFRLASGTEEECREQLEKEKDKNLLPRMTGRAVILIHGIIRSSKSFSVMKKRLEDSGVTVVGFDYPSTQVSLQECATYFKKVLESLDGIEQIDLVVHSMGGLLVRTYLQMEGEKRDPRLHRMVMLGVPNLGADMATKLHENWAFQWTLGPAGQQLVRGGGSFISALPIPDFEFAVIAGCRGTEHGWNMLIPGDDDGTVSVDSTRLPGAADFMAIRVLHSTMMWNQDVIESSIRFLETGALRNSEDRTPIPLSETKPVPKDEMPPEGMLPVATDS